jgi:hypothetical protein
MGRKGVSKRKPSKSKAAPEMSSNTFGSLSAIARSSESPAPQILGKGESISTGKNGKKKSSDSHQRNKKR